MIDSDKRTNFLLVRKIAFEVSCMMNVTIKLHIQDSTLFHFFSRSKQGFEMILYQKGHSAISYALQLQYSKAWNMPSDYFLDQRKSH